MPIHEDAFTTFRGFPVIGMGDRSYVYQAKLFAVGFVHCVYKIDSKLGKKYDGWFVFTGRGQAMIDLNKMLAISDRLLEYGSFGVGHYKWVLTPPHGDDLRFSGLGGTGLWKSYISKEIIAEDTSEPVKITRCKQYFRDNIYKVEKLISELQYRSKARFDPKIYFNAILFKDSLNWISLNPNYVKFGDTYPTREEDIVRWTENDLSLRSDFPLKDGENSRGWCGHRRLRKFPYKLEP